MAARFVFLLAVAISAVAAVPTSSLIDYINSVQDSWTAGINSLSDKSEEYKNSLCGVLREPLDTLPVKEDVEILENIPASFDARKHWPHCPTIKSIKDQGQCGSCWAIGATSSFSDRLCIATNNKVKLNISEENLAFCCIKCVATSGCDGGYPLKAWQYLQSTGVVTGGDYDSNEGCQPYEIPPGESSTSLNVPICQLLRCTNKKYGKSYDKDLHYGKSAYVLPSLNVKAMQSEILKYGPVEATFAVYTDFDTYTKGVYKHVSGSLRGYHAVRVLGLGTEKRTPYWLVANSWGTAWGDNGHFKILRGSNECGFESFVLAGQVKH